MWRTGDTVKMKFMVGFISLIKEIITARLSIISAIDNSSFRNLCLGTLWQLATANPDSLSL